MSNVTEFERCWKKFTDKLKGKLITEAKNGGISHNSASTLLSDAAVSWGLSYDECGRWLIKYAEDSSEKATAISQLLTRDMKFSKLPPKKSIPNSVKYIIPIVGAAAGFAVSYMLHAPIAVQAVSTAIPPILIYPAVNAIGNMLEARNTDAVINEYMAQLEKYRQSIISILEEH